MKNVHLEHSTLMSMKYKAKYQEQVELSDIESTIKILLQGELITLPKRTVDKWFKKAFVYLQQDQQYETMALLRDAQLRYKKQLK